MRLRLLELQDLLLRGSGQFFHSFNLLFTQKLMQVIVTIIYHKSVKLEKGGFYRSLSVKLERQTFWSHCYDSAIGQHQLSSVTLYNIFKDSKPLRKKLLLKPWRTKSRVVPVSGENICRDQPVFCESCCQNQS